MDKHPFMNSAGNVMVGTEIEPNLKYFVIVWKKE